VAEAKLIEKYKKIRKVALAARQAASSVSGYWGDTGLSGWRTAPIPWPSVLVAGNIRFNRVAPAGTTKLAYRKKAGQWLYCGQKVEAMYAYQVPGEDLWVCIFLVKRLPSCVTEEQREEERRKREAYYESLWGYKGNLGAVYGSPATTVVGVYINVFTTSQYNSIKSHLNSCKREKDVLRPCPMYSLSISGLTATKIYQKGVGTYAGGLPVAPGGPPVAKIYGPHSIVFYPCWSCPDEWSSECPKLCTLWPSKVEYQISDTYPLCFFNTSLELCLFGRAALSGKAYGWKKRVRNVYIEKTYSYYAGAGCNPLIESQHITTATNDIIAAAEPMSVIRNAQMDYKFKEWAERVLKPYIDEINALRAMGINVRDLIPEDLMRLFTYFYPDQSYAPIVKPKPKPKPKVAPPLPPLVLKPKPEKPPEKPKEVTPPPIPKPTLPPPKPKEEKPAPALAPTPPKEITPPPSPVYITAPAAPAPAPTPTPAPVVKAEFVLGKEYLLPLALLALAVTAPLMPKEKVKPKEKKEKEKIKK